MLGPGRVLLPLICKSYSAWFSFSILRYVPTLVHQNQQGLAVGFPSCKFYTLQENEYFQAGSRQLLNILNLGLQHSKLGFLAVCLLFFFILER